MDIDVFVDYLQVMHTEDRDVDETSVYSNFILGGLTTLADSGPNGQRIKNALLLKRAQTFNPEGSFDSYGMLGTSFYTQGAPVVWATANGNSLYWNPGNAAQPAGSKQPCRLF